MNPKDYLALQRAHNAVRRTEPKQKRLATHDLQLLAYIKSTNSTKTIQELAQYSGAQVPTTTVRTRRLQRKGAIKKVGDTLDKRKIICKVTPKGEAMLAETIARIYEFLEKPSPLYQVSQERLYSYFSAMASVELAAKDLIILVLYLSSSAKMNITKMSEITKMLEPTVSSAVALLEKEKLIAKEKEGYPCRKDVLLLITKEGKARAEQLLGKIQDIVVKRPKKAYS